MTGYQRALDEVGHHSHDAQGRRLTVDQIAERMGDRPSHMRKALSAYDDAHPLNAAKVVPLTLATGNTALVRYFCEATGGIYVALPHVHTADHVDVVEQSQAAIKEFGEVLASAGQAVADGSVSDADVAAFTKEADEAIAAILQFKELMRRKAGLDRHPLRAVEGGQR